MFAKNAETPEPGAERRGVHLRLTKGTVALFAVLILAPWVVLLCGAMLRTPTPEAAPIIVPTVPVSAADTRRTQSPPQVVAGRSTSPTSRVLTPGPWGELEITPIVIEPAAEMLGRMVQVDSSKWYFAEATPGTVDELLKTVGLNEHQRTTLLQTARGEPDINGVSVTPEPSLIFTLHREVRQALYEQLWKCRKNLQAEPFRRPYDPTERWFGDSGLGGENAALAQRLVYRLGTLEAFADVSAILTVITDEADRINLFRALSQQSSYLINLRIRPDTDVSPLIEYWGKGGREREVGPMLRAIKRLPEGGMINVADLLPPFPRARVHTYAPPVGSAVNGPLDCHWTTLNFWNDAPDNQFLVADKIVDQLVTSYRKIDKASQLGDIVLLIDDRQNGIHSAIHIADDLYLTKNGSNLAAPWQFMRFEEMTTYYETLRIKETVFFRKNGL